MGSHANHIVMPMTYVRNLAILMILMLATIAATWVNLGTIPNLLVAMGIGCVKTYFIVTIFMHLKFSSKLTVIFAVAGFIWLLILFTLIWADYFTRWWITPFIDGKMGG